MIDGDFLNWMMTVHGIFTMLMILATTLMVLLAGSFAATAHTRIFSRASSVYLMVSLTIMMIKATSRNLFHLPAERAGILVWLNLSFALMTALVSFWKGEAHSEKTRQRNSQVAANRLSAMEPEEARVVIDKIGPRYIIRDKK